MKVEDDGPNYYDRVIMASASPLCTTNRSSDDHRLVLCNTSYETTKSHVGTVLPRENLDWRGHCTRNRLHLKSTEIGHPRRQCYDFFWKSLACMFLVMLGSLTSSPSISGDILIWQPRRDVSVSPNARSNMSFSSSSGSSILS